MDLILKAYLCHALFKYRVTRLAIIGPNGKLLVKLKKIYIYIIKLVNGDLIRDYLVCQMKNRLLM